MTDENAVKREVIYDYKNLVFFITTKNDSLEINLFWTKDGKNFQDPHGSRQLWILSEN
ncbi:hypothetical protein CPAV1605_1428 [seawater metagenome]|uniref:Uncharacterized protein n=1 Tax=seawater metagenome TaxID=1561972 RepID=A0A5E8CJT6_9ZZZZ